MLGFRSRPARPAEPATAAGPAGRLGFAIGDVHGHAGLLADLIGRIDRDIAASSFEGRPALILLGDYVDRGPDSRGVIELILRLADSGRYELTALRGNHEQVLLDFAETGASGAAWMNFGGAETLRSYGVTPPARSPDADWPKLARTLRAALPPRHLRFFQDTRIFAEFGDYLFVHAGVRPGVPIAEQQTGDMLQIREPFLRAADPLPGRTVVFGHTPAEAPRIGPGKIGIDTGAYATGVLTALRISGPERRFLSTVRAAPRR